MEGFLTQEEQKAIKKELKKLQGYAEENNKSFVKNSNNAISKLASIELLRANMMTTNGGGLFFFAAKSFRKFKSFNNCAVIQSTDRR